MGGGDEPGLGVDRRRVIKQGMAAAGIFWAVPTIQSVTNPAGAQAGSAPPGDGCEDGAVMGVFVKYEVGKGFVPANVTNPPGTCLGGGCPAANAWAAAQMNAHASVVGGGNGVCITIAPEFLMIQAVAAHKGNNGCDATPDPGSNLASGKVCFDKDTDTPRPGGGVSSVSVHMSACVPQNIAAGCP